MDSIRFKIGVGSLPDVVEGSRAIPRPSAPNVASSSLPESGRLRSVWNFLIAATVRGPVCPSGVPMSYPARVSAACARFTTSSTRFIAGPVSGVPVALAVVLLAEDADAVPRRPGRFDLGLVGTRAFAVLIEAHDAPRSSER